MTTQMVKQNKLGHELMKKAIAQGGPLTVGAESKAVAMLERALQIVGFDPGNRDRSFTKDTARAVGELQAAWGLPKTGKLDAKTLAKLDHTLGRATKHGSGCPDCNKKGFQGSLGIGQKNLDVHASEKRLRALGYDTGKVDGIFDQRTAKAVVAFKKDQDGFKDDTALVTKKTYEALGKAMRNLQHAPYRGRKTKGLKAQRRLNEATAEHAKKHPIGEGSPKRLVQNVQRHLAAAGYNPARKDGVFDERTQNALNAFQKKSNLDETKAMGGRTWAKLRQAVILAKDGTSPAQQKGERSVAVKRSEKILHKLGFKGVKVDGFFDGKTQAASRKFEKRFPGLGDNGDIGDGQLQRMRQVLEAKQHPGKGPLLKKGYRGQPVKILQRRLSNMGFKAGGVDGDFGKGTAQAVRKFQHAFGLESDGVVGKRTWRMLGVKSKGKVHKPGQANGGGGVNAGKGWGGTEGVADTAKRIAASMGIPITSQKRTLAQTQAVGSSIASDHYVGNTNAFAVDFGVSGDRGEELARKICKAYGVSTSNLGTFNGPIITVDGQQFRLQILWRVAGHFDHVHVGIRRV